MVSKNRLEIPINLGSMESQTDVHKTSDAGILRKLQFVQDLLPHLALYFLISLERLHECEPGSLDPSMDVRVQSRQSRDQLDRIDSESLLLQHTGADFETREEAGVIVHGVVAMFLEDRVEAGANFAAVHITATLSHESTRRLEHLWTCSITR